MAIQSSSAVLKAYFETGDVPTAAQFGDFIDSTAYYDHSLEKLFLSGSGTGSIPYVSAKSINPYTGSNTINVSASLIPPYTAAGSGSNLGATFTPWETIYAVSASINHLCKYTGSAAINVSGGLNPSITSGDGVGFNLGAPSAKWKELHVSGINVDYISSSLIPDQDNLRDLGSSGREWKDLYIDGTAYIDTLSTGTSFATLTATTASLTIVSSSRIDGVGGYGNIIISGGLVPGTTNVFDLGTTVKKWKTLHVSGASIDFVSSSLIPDQDNLRDLGSSGREWKDLYVDGTAYIDTLSISTIPTVTITTASITVISSSRIDGVGGYGNIIISGGLVPGTTNVFDLGSSTKSWKDLHAKSIIIGTGSIGVVSSSRIDGVQYGDILISGSLIPGTTNKFDLGDNQNKWLNLYVSGAAIDAVSSSLIPDQDNLRDLGSSAKEWKDLYIDGIANIDTLSTDTASIGRIATSLIPTANDTSFLGTTDFKYKNIHVISSSIDYVSSSLIPHKTEVYDLGSAALKWRSASIKHITASTIIVDKLVTNTTTFAATETITGSNQFGTGSSNVHSFSGSITAVTDITASGNISASGTITAGTFNFANSSINTTDISSSGHIWVSGGSAANLVFLSKDGGHITASGNISSSKEFIGASAYITNITASGNISASGEIYATGKICSYNMITSSVGFSTIGGHLSASDDSGSVQIISGGIYISRNNGISQDDYEYTVHGRRFTVQSQLQAALPASQSTSIWTVNNHSVNDGDVILGTFMGLTGAGVGTLAQSASIHCFTTASLGQGFHFYIHNNKSTAIADDSDFTASFVVL